MRSRGRRTACGAAIVAATLAACSAAKPRARPASPAESGWTDAPSPPRAPSRPLERWELAEQLRALRPATRRAPSGHLTGELEADVLAGGAGPYPALGPETRLPAGATLVERLFEPGASAPFVYFVMVKRAPGFDTAGGDWEYLVVSRNAEIEERGVLPLCARCHAEAPHDHVFGGGR